MMSATPETTAKCQHCGELFRTSEQHPRRYCSVMCEDGRRAKSIDDPSSEGYHLHLQGEPQALVGKTLIAEGLKYSDDVTEDWHKSPDELATVWLSDDETELVYKTSMVVGVVTGFDESGHYTIEKEYLETGEIVEKRVMPSDVLERIRNDTWWVE